MAGTTPFTIGADASCTDGACGKVSRVIVDPAARAVTHLVVEPKHRRGHGRLVPVGLVDTSTGEIRLRCTKAEFEKLDPAEETQQIVEDRAPELRTYQRTRRVADPALGMGGRQYLTEDSVPLGEVEVRPESTSMPPTATSGRSRGSSSTLRATT